MVLVQCSEGEMCFAGDLNIRDNLVFVFVKTGKHFRVPTIGRKVMLADLKEERPMSIYFMSDQKFISSGVLGSVSKFYICHKPDKSLVSSRTKVM